MLPFSYPSLRYNESWLNFIGSTAFLRLLFFPKYYANFCESWVKVHLVHYVSYKSRGISVPLTPHVEGWFTHLSDCLRPSGLWSLTTREYTGAIYRVAVEPSGFPYSLLFFRASFFFLIHWKKLLTMSKTTISHWWYGHFISQILRNIHSGEMQFRGHLFSSVIIIKSSQIIFIFHHTWWWGIPKEKAVCVQLDEPSGDSAKRNNQNRQRNK